MLTNNTISGALDSYYVRKANQEERGCPVRGSQTGACPRKISSLLAGAPTLAIPAKSSRVFEDGSLRGIALAKALSVELKDKGYVTALEVPVFTEIPGIEDPDKVVEKLRSQFPSQDADGIGVCSGRNADGRLVLLLRSRIDLLVKDSSYSIVEIKGKSSYGMKMLPSEGPGQDYICQIGAQILGCVREGWHVSSAHFLFENKDSNEWVPLEVNMQMAMLAAETALQSLAATLNAYAKDGFTGLEGFPQYAPPIETEKGKLPWQCNYCSVGPIAGNCVPGRKLIDVRKPGASVPAWTFE